MTGYAYAGCDPERMGLGPVYAIAKAATDLGLGLADADLVEINEAFAAQVLAVLRAMKSDKFCRKNLRREQALGEIPADRLNVNGGAIALGHPVGATGARLVLTRAERPAPAQGAGALSSPFAWAEAREPRCGWRLYERDAGNGASESGGSPKYPPGRGGDLRANVRPPEFRRQISSTRRPCSNSTGTSRGSPRLRKSAGLILHSAKPGIFIAGADLHALMDAAERGALRPVIELGQRVFSRLAALPIPTVAAIHGACAGGGYEVSLACNYRIASPDAATRIGLPETQLGILPGWGGCARLPRLVGAARRAQDHPRRAICQSARQALKSG